VVRPKAFWLGVIDDTVAQIGPLLLFFTDRKPFISSVASDVRPHGGVPRPRFAITAYILPHIRTDPTALSYTDLRRVIVKVVLRDLKVERRRSSADASGDIVVGSVAGAEPASVVSGFTDWDTTEMCAVEDVSGCRWRQLPSAQAHQTPSMTSLQ